MKRTLSMILGVFLIFSLCACGQKAPTWQEQYDLGVRYLSEGNYEEAIIAFTAAIEIDPKQADAYVSLADTYILQGDYEKAKEVLEKCLEGVGWDQAIENKLSEILPYTGVEIEGGFFFTFPDEDALTYEDLPVIFSMDFSTLDTLWGLEMPHQPDERRSYGEADFGDGLREFSYLARHCAYRNGYNSPAVGYSKAPFDSDNIISAGIWRNDDTTDGEGWGVSTGWLDICLGDEFGTVLDKLRIAETVVGKLQPCKRVDIYVGDGESGYGIATNTSGDQYEGLTELYVWFCSGDLNELNIEKSVHMLFDEENHIYDVIFTNDVLNKSMIEKNMS